MKEIALNSIFWEDMGSGCKSKLESIYWYDVNEEGIFFFNLIIYWVKDKISTWAKSNVWWNVGWGLKLKVSETFFRRWGWIGESSMNIHWHNVISLIVLFLHKMLHQWIYTTIINTLNIYICSCKASIVPFTSLSTMSQSFQINCFETN